MRILYGPDVLYDPASGVELLGVELTRSLREASTLTFKMPRSHDAYGKIKLESVEPQIEVWDGSRLIMQGRAWACEDVDDVGTVEYSCEGELAYLNDTSVRPYSTVAGAAPALAPSDPYGYFGWLIENHNAKVEPVKSFTVGVNQGHLLDKNNHILRSDSTYPTTGTVIKEKLLESLGGFVRARYEGGARYVDYLADTDGTAAQRVELGVNLLRFARTRDGSPIYSAVIPLGAKPEGSDDRITIGPLGNGDADGYGRYVKRGDALVSVDLVAKVGYREIAVEWDDVAEPENLLARGLSWLPAQANEIETIKLSAYDMSRIDPDVKPFELGDYARVTSLPHDYDSYMIVSRIVMRPTDAAGHEYTFGLDGDDIGDIVRKHAQTLNSGINDVYEKAEAVDKIAKDAQERADAAKGAADEAQAGADAAKEAADKAKSDAEKAAADALEAARDALDAKREADEATAKVEVAETDLRVVREAVAGAQGAADAASEAAGDAEAKADAASQAAADAKSESQGAFESAASAIATAEAAQAEAAGAKADADKVRTDLAGQIKTVTDTMAADYSKKTDLTQTEARLASEIERSAAGIASTVAETYAKKTDLTSVELDLQTRIEQNADAITSTAKSVSEVDAKANDAASEASAASAAASKAQADAASAATGAGAAQAAADEAARNLAIAEKNLDAVATRVGATEEDVKAAEAAVATAKGAADAASAAATAAKTDAAAAQATADTAKTAAEAARKAADALGTRVTAAETKIEQNADAITLRATKTEAQGYASTAKSEAVSAAAGDATAKANNALAGAKTYADAQIKVSADSITSSVSKTYAKKTLPDTRSKNETPQWYFDNYPQQVVTEFKTASVIGLSGETYATLETTVPWTGSSGGYPKQCAQVGGKVYWRIGTSATAWGAWKDSLSAADASATYSTKSELKQESDRITSNVTETNGLKSRMSTVEQTASGLSVSLGNTDKAVAAAQSAADTAKANAATAQSTANTAKTNAATAQTTANTANGTANTAKTNAATAQSTADTAKANAATAQGTANTANSTANTAKANAATAQSTADTAKTNAATAQSTANTARTEAANAAKTATNYMEYSSAGLDVGNKTSGKWAGFRTRMASSAFQVLDSTGAVLASYGAKLVELGKNATDAVIRLCGGKGEISLKKNQAGNSALTVSGSDVQLLATLYANIRAQDANGNFASVTAAPGYAQMLCGAVQLFLSAAELTLDASGKPVNLNPMGGAVTVRGNPVYGRKTYYDNFTGTTGTVTIADEWSTINMAEFHYKTNDGEVNCTRVLYPEGKTVNLTSARITGADGAGWIKSKQLQLSGKTAAYIGYAGESGMGSNSGGSNYVGSIIIIRIIGWK